MRNEGSNGSLLYLTRGQMTHVYMPAIWQRSKERTFTLSSLAELAATDVSLIQMKLSLKYGNCLTEHTAFFACACSPVALTIAKEVKRFSTPGHCALF